MFKILSLLILASLSLHCFGSGVNFPLFKDISVDSNHPSVTYQEVLKGDNTIVFSRKGLSIQTVELEKTIESLEIHTFERYYHFLGLEKLPFKVGLIIFEPDQNSPDAFVVKDFPKYQDYKFIHVSNSLMRSSALLVSLAHEISHLLYNHYKTSGTRPDWENEGIAEYFKHFI